MVEWVGRDREITLETCGHGGPRDRQITLGTCGHDGPPRRVCDACKAARYAFTACSHECLRKHQRAVHDPAMPADTATRARRAQVERNRRSADVWDLFASHRARLMALIPPDTAGGTLCVLGAGRCDDLDLPFLAGHFATIHLVDIDREAMERARDRQPPAVRNALVLHGGLDVSGLLERLDEWGDNFPDDHDLLQAVFSAAHAVAGALGGPFDVTLSTCILSQLVIPFRGAWAAPEATWSKLNAAVTAIHVALLARTTAARGAALLAFDVLCSEEAPELAALRGHPTEELRATVNAWAQAGVAVLEPDPFTLLAQVSQLGIAAPEPGPRLTEPWLWDTGTALHLVYALSFRKA